MKVYKINLVYFFIWTFIVQNSFSQTQEEWPVPKFNSPQVAAIMRYDNMPIAQNTGRIDLSIPVVDFLDPDFDFPITLSYNSGGFKPSDPEGIVGLNWSLNFGGIIYREVRGVPDDIDTVDDFFITDGINALRDRSLKGFLHVREMNLGKDYKDYVYEKPTEALPNVPYNVYPMIKGSQQVEGSSDLYTFNFNGYNGKFMIDFDGTPKVVSYSGKGKVSINLSGYNLHSNNIFLGGMNIKIETDNGYIYTFGGNHSAVEYTATSWIDYCNMARRPKNIAISAFHLTKIKAPNGRILHVNYLQDQEKYFLYPEELIHAATANKDLLKNYSLHGSTAYIGSLFTLAGGYEIHPSIYKKYYTLSKVALISSIVTDNQRIDFSYSNLEKTIFKDDSDEACSKFGKLCGAKLDAVKIYTTSGELIESCSLIYKQKDRLFLEEVVNSRNGKYSFSYNPLGNISPFTKSVDHWGYYNNRNGELIPIYGKNEKDREAGGNCSIGLLKSIKYPTGGFAEFEYEPQIESDDYRVGGARIRHVKHYKDLNDSSPLVKYYTYVNNKTKTGTGKITKLLPEYKFSYTLNSNSTEPLGIRRIGNSYGHNLINPDTYHVQYSEVNEYINPTILTGDSSDSLIYRISFSPLSPQEGGMSPLMKVDNENIEWTIEYRGVAQYQPETDKKSFIKIYKKDPSLGYIKEFKAYEIRKGDDVTLKLRPYNEFGKGEYRVLVTGGNGNFALFKSEIINDKNLNIKGGYTTTVFSNIADYGSTSLSNMAKPDLSSVIPKTERGDTDLYYVKARPISKSHMRGQILGKYYYTKDNKLIKSERYIYEENIGNKANYVTDVNAPCLYMDEASLMIIPFNHYFQVTKLYFEPYNLVKIETIDYLNHSKIDDQSVKSEEIYNYSTDGYYIKNRSLLTPDGKVISTNYKYAFELDKEPYLTMLRMSILSPIIEEKRVQGNAITTEKRNYIIWDKSLNPNFGENRNIVLSSIESSFGNNPLELQGECLEYDQFGNILYYKSKSNQHIVYLWSYLGKYPIAEIKNATYQQVISALDGLDLDKISLSSDPETDGIFKKIKELGSKLPNSLVTTYTYKPLIGVSTVTSPIGIKTYYNYDAKGRLQEIYIIENGVKKILEAHEYNYVNQ